jgi:hypothetical protein
MLCTCFSTVSSVTQSARDPGVRTAFRHQASERDPAPTSAARFRGLFLVAFRRSTSAPCSARPPSGPNRPTSKQSTESVSDLIASPSGAGRRTWSRTPPSTTAIPDHPTGRAALMHEARTDGARAARPLRRQLAERELSADLTVWVLRGVDAHAEEMLVEGGQQRRRDGRRAGRAASAGPRLRGNATTS